MILLISAFAVAAWVYLFALHGWFWRSRPVLEVGASSSNARVTVVVPARNEAENIAQIMASLVAQEYAGPLQIVLVDDNSRDRTVEIAAELAAHVGSAGRLAIVRGAALPAGWSGKMWAAHQGLAHEAARSADGAPGDMYQWRWR